MYLITILLLLFSNLFILITNAEKPLSRRVNPKKFYDDNGNCVCFPGGQSLIPELHEMERLVIYLYRKVNTNQIILHKPSVEKQNLIPNVPFTEDDLLRVVTADTVASLFNNYPHNVPSQDHADPIGLKIGTIQSVSQKTNLKGFSSFYSNSNDPVHLSIGKYLDQSQQPSTSWYPNKQKFINPQQPNVKVNNGQPQPNYVEFNNPFQSNSVHPNNPNIPKIISKTSNIWESKHFTPVSPLQSNPQLMEPDENKLLKYHEEEPAPRWPKPNLTFDNWFNKQMELFHYQQVTQDIGPINKDELRKLIKETLFENHIQIGATGMMTDENGTLINLEHLDLRPILIGDPVKFHTLQENQRLTLSQTKPHFEGLLITFNNPPKILGIIPLGKTYISSQEQIVKASNSPSIQHYKITQTNQPESIPNNVKIPLYADSSNNILNPVISSSWRRGSRNRPKAKKVEPKSTKTEKVPEAEESVKTSKSTKISKSLETLGELESKVLLGPSNGTMVPKTQKEAKKSNNSKRSFAYNPDPHFISAHRWLKYNNIYNVPFSSWVVEPNENAESSVISKGHDSESLQLILSPINFSTGTHGGSDGTQLTLAEFTSKPDSHVIVTSFDGNSKTYANPSTTSNSPHLTVTELSGNPKSYKIITSLEGNSESYLNPSTETRHRQLTVEEFTGKPDYYLDGKLSTNPNVFEPHSFNPKLIVSPLGNKLDFNSNPYSRNHNGHITHINSPRLTVSPYNTRTDSKWKSDSNSVWIFYPNNNEPASTNWQQMPSIYHKIRGFKSPVPYLYVTRSENQVATPPDAEKPSRTGIQKAEGTTQQHTAPVSNFVDTENQNEVVIDFGDLNNVTPLRRFSSPSFQGVLKTFLKMVLHNILLEGSETAVKNDDKTNGTGPDIHVNSTNHSGKTGVVEDLERPDYRIIGGSAATGSGAPLSNKGRSGRL